MKNINAQNNNKIITKYTASIKKRIGTKTPAERCYFITYINTDKYTHYVIYVYDTFEIVESGTTTHILIQKNNVYSGWESTNAPTIEINDKVCNTLFDNK